MSETERDGSARAADAPAGARWYFYEVPAAGWQWDHVDGQGTLIARAPAPLESRTACVADAKMHGYASGDGLAA